MVRNDQSLLFRSTSDSSYIQYVRDDSVRNTRFSLSFSNPTAMTGQFPRLIRASVQLLEGESAVSVHSVARTFCPPTHNRLSFLERIRAQPNQSLWRTFVTDGDGSWMYESLLNNTLVMMSDGAYEPLLAEDVCSCAMIVMCTRTGQRASLTWAERSDRLSADNYRAEILGGIALQLLVKVACEGKYLSPSMSPRFGCDNKGVVHHGNHQWRPLPANQGQADERV